MMSGSFRLVSAAAITVGLVVASTHEAEAADPAPAMPPLVEPAQPLSFSGGVAVLSDYNFRGVTQTRRRPAIQAYGEVGIYDFAYVNAFASNVSFADKVEIDVGAGIRPSLGPIDFDLGFVHYFYPGAAIDFTEVYAKAAYTYENFTVGANVFYAWDIARAGQHGTYAALTASVDIPQLEGLTISGEVGRYFLGAVGGAKVPDYTYWNVGAAYTYEIVTVGLRYHGTENNTCSGGGTKKTCGHAVIASFSVDF